MPEPTIRRAEPADSAALHHLAATTFPLACPPGTTAEDVDAFVREVLSTERFDDYLADPHRDLLVAAVGGTLVGYAMLVAAEPADPEVAAVVTARPTVELSKCYVLAEQHGLGVAAALMGAAVDAARLRGAASLWLGVNQLNARANRFYEKNGFALACTKRFLVGAQWHDDFCRVRPL